MKNQQSLDKTTRTFELLGNPLRMKIFMAILNEGCKCQVGKEEGCTGNCVSGIMEKLSLPQSTVSSYIKDLESTGVVVCKKKGKYVYCYVCGDCLTAIKKFIDSAVEKTKIPPN